MIRPSVYRTFALRSLTTWAIGLGLISLVLGAANVIDILLLAFAGLLISLVLGAAVSLFKPATGGRRSVALFAVASILIGTCALLLWFLLPRIGSQAEELSKVIPDSFGELQRRVGHYEWGRWAINHAPSLGELSIPRRELFGRITGVVSNIVEVVGLVFVVAIISLYLAAEPDLYLNGVIKLVPPAGRVRARFVLERIGSQLRWWLLGKFIAMFLVGAATWIGLAVLGVSSSLTLALLAAVMTFIPNFGPIIAAVPAVLVALTISPATAGWVAVLYLAVQTVESYAITPLVQRKTVSLPPALTILSQLVLGVLIGGIGLALATPLTVVLLVAIRLLYVEDVLGDRTFTDEAKGRDREVS